MAIDNTINGRTPEEIMVGLEFCITNDVARKMEIVKQGLPYFYTEHVATDCLALIQQIEAKNTQLQELCDNLDIALVKQTRQLAEKELVLLKTVEEFVEKTPKWISVKDNPPDGTKDVIAYNMYGEMLIGHVLTMSNGKEYYCETLKDNIYHVTHWMPRPESPKEEV